jgi:hypothetical protein
MIDEKYLKDSYLEKKMSVSQIASEYGCSQNKITYWLQKHNIQKRSISNAVYIRSNPNGDPFSYKKPRSESDWFLYGLGLGLFWGEGNKMSKNSVRLGNTDADLIKKFLLFLKVIYQIQDEKLRFGLQIFNDIPKDKALNYWSTKLSVPKSRFQKVVVTKSVRKGTYKKKSEYGVLTVYFSNTKLRDTIMSAITKLRDKE